MQAETADINTFPADVEVGLTELRKSVATIIESICGTGSRAKDVADGLKINSKLGWQFWNVAYGSAAEALRCLPNDPGFETLKTAAARHGLPGSILEDLESARGRMVGAFAAHAEDREMLQMLVEARAEEPSLDSTTKWRRSAFLGNCFTFGVRAKCLLATAVLYPHESGRFSMVRLHGLVDLVRMRTGVRWPLATLVVEKESEAETFHREPLAPADWDPKTAPLLSEFCSQPIPGVVRRMDGNRIVDELAPGMIGLTGKSTVFFGEIIRDVGPVKAGRAGEIAHFGSGVRTPAQLLVSDHIVHRDLFPSVDRQLRVYSELATNHARDDADLLQVPERLEHLGRGLARVPTADVPRYAELLTHVFERIGQNPADFEVFRVKMPYPPIPISVMVQHPLPHES